MSRATSTDKTADYSGIHTVGLGLLECWWNVFERRFEPVIKLTSELAHHLRQTVHDENNDKHSTINTHYRLVHSNLVESESLGNSTGRIYEEF